MSPEHIRILRQRLGLTQPEMAERINQVDPLLRVTANAISRYERGKHKPAPHVQGAMRVLAIDNGIDLDGIPSYDTIQHGHYRQLIELCDRAIAGDKDAGFSASLATQIRRLSIDTLRETYGVEIE